MPTPRIRLLGLLFVAAASIVGLAACNSGAPSSNPTTSPSMPSNVTTSTVTVKHNGGTLANQVVNEYSALGPSAGPNTQGVLITSQTTDASGRATFTGLTPGTPYCWVFTLLQGGIKYTGQVCSANWSNGLTLSN